MAEPGKARSPDDEIADLVSLVRSNPSRREELVGLLAENAVVHVGQGAADTARLRAWALAAFAEVGLPDAALPYVIEELESGDEPILVAAAAKAVGGLRPPDPALAGPLVRALWNIAGRDDTVSFAALRPTWPAPDPTTPLLEILAALRDLGPGAGVRSELVEFLRADGTLLSPTVRASLERTIATAAALPVPHCCGGGRVLAGDDGRRASSLPVPRGVEVEDQDGGRLVLADFVALAPTVLAFFYTRCGNPRKCSLTVTSLAELCRELARPGRLGPVQVAAITYDPGYDVPARLLRYGRDRGLPFGPAVRMFRATAGHDLLREHFALRVGYTASVVNRHSIELFLLDSAGQVRRTWTRRRWVPADVLADLLHRGFG